MLAVNCALHKMCSYGTPLLVYSVIKPVTPSCWLNGQAYLAVIHFIRGDTDGIASKSSLSGALCHKYLWGDVCRKALQQGPEGQHAVQQGHEAAWGRYELAVKYGIQGVERCRQANFLLKTLWRRESGGVQYGGHA